MNDMFRYQVEVVCSGGHSKDSALGFDFEKYATPSVIQEIVKRLSIAFPLAEIRLGIVTPATVDVMYTMKKGVPHENP